MVIPQLAPRGTAGGIVGVWIATAVAGVIIGVFAPANWRAEYLSLTLAGSVIVSFAVQLWTGRSQRFIMRVAASVLGALIVLGVISAGFGLASLVPV